MWRHYKTQPGFVLGFHGCDRKVGEDLLRKGGHLTPSNNPWDWLGEGIYFWEGNPARALEFAQEAKKKPKLSKGHIKNPFVLGAVIDLGQCCNLLSTDALQEVARAHRVMSYTYKATGTEIPRNKGEDLGARFLDAAVIGAMHTIRIGSGFPAYDTVRAAFWEGAKLYDGAGFAAKNHIQIAVCNPNCIKGYFRPIVHQDA